MNYYERHIGDYAKDAGHLSMLEHGAYTLLLDRYYSTEQGIPADQAYKVAHARSKTECAAVDLVLNEFFVLADGVWTKNKVQEVIADVQARINAAQTNGKLGGRPKTKPKVNPDETHEKPTGLLLGSENETQTKALQSPISNLQSPISKREDRTKALAEARAVVGLDVSAFDRWIEYRRTRKPEVRTISLVECAEKLAKFGDRQLETVKNSISEGYQGLIEPRAPPNGVRPVTPIKLKTAEEWEAIERERGESHAAN